MKKKEADSFIKFIKIKNARIAQLEHRSMKIPVLVNANPNANAKVQRIFGTIIHIVLVDALQINAVETLF